jgi:hypothetical protein
MGVLDKIVELLEAILVVNIWILIAIAVSLVQHRNR